MSGVTDDIERRLAEAAEASREHEVTTERLADLQQRRDELQAQVDELRAVSAIEDQDVERLETRSLSRVLVSLLGTREEKLGRERAEADAARYRLDDAESRLNALISEHRAAEERMSVLAEAPYTFAAVLEEKERHLAASGDPRARRVLEIAELRGKINGELRELTEATDAADAAWEALSTLRDALEGALGPSVLDTFFGSGALTADEKHVLLDEAAQAATHADKCLALLRTELLDVHDLPLNAPHLATETVVRFAEVWFDNIFADLAVHRRVKKAHEGVEECIQHVGYVVNRLAQQTAHAHDTLRVLDTERHDLLVG